MHKVCIKLIYILKSLRKIIILLLLIRGSKIQVALEKGKFVIGKSKNSLYTQISHINVDIKRKK